MKHRSLTRWWPLLALALLLTACSVKEDPPVEIPEIEVTYTEQAGSGQDMAPYAPGRLYPKGFWRAEVEGRTYDFDKSIPEEQRTEIVCHQEAFLGLLAEQGLDTEGLWLRITPDSRSFSDSDNRTIYLGMNESLSWTQALVTVQTMMGDYTNYGYLYALADRFAGRMGWARDDAAKKNVVEFIITPELLNLVYPCFDEAYAAPAQIAACKALALSLYETDVTEAEFMAAIESYAAEQGLDYAPTYLTFAFYGESCPLKFRTNYLEVFRDKTYQSSTYVRRGLIGAEEDEFYSVSSVLGTFTDLDTQLAHLREVFSVTNETLISTRMCEEEMIQRFGRGGELWGLTWYGNGEDDPEIYAVQVDVIVHEYVHYLTYARGGIDDPGYEYWIAEVPAEYYGIVSRYNDRYYSALNGQGGPVEAFSWLIGQDYDEPFDEILLRHYFMPGMTEDYTLWTLLKLYEFARPCLADYFIQTYGETAFIESVVAPSKTAEYTGYTFDEIAEQWMAWVMEGNI